MTANSSRRTSAYRRWRATLPGRVDSRRGRCLAWLDMQVMDHGFLRPFFNRPYEFAPAMYRSNQPTPRRIRKLANQGVRTIINLRGASDRGAYVLEQWACERYGVSLIDLDMSSRKAPRAETIRQLVDCVSNAEHPVLLHCKSGADRAGLAAAICLILQGAPIAKAQQQLSFRFLHVKRAKTGVLDQFLENYRLDYESEPITFTDWLDKGYDRQALKRGFKPSGWANILVDKVLRRE